MFVIIEGMKRVLFSKMVFFGMMTLALFLFAISDAEASGMTRVESAAKSDAHFSIPFAKSQPTIDGCLGESEWNEGVTLAGLFSPAGHGFLADGGDGLVTFLADGKSLFVAWRVRAASEDVDGGLVSTAKMRDGAVYDDDSVELVMQGDDPGRIAHFVFNSIGTVYDSLSATGGRTDVKWNCTGLRVKSSVRAGWWEVEAAVPISSIGPATGGLWVNAARAFHGRGAASLNASSSHVFGPKLRLDWVQDAPAVKMYNLGRPSAGYWSPKLAVFGGKPDSRFVCEMTICKEGVADHIPAKAFQRKTLASGQRMSVKFNTRQRDPFRLTVHVTDSITGKKIYERTILSARGNKTEKIPSRANFDLGEAEASVYHYPGYGMMRVNVSSSSASPLRSAVCSINGQKHELHLENGIFTALFAAPDKDGAYPVDFVLKSDSGIQRYEKAWTLERMRQTWEGNDIGKRRAIIPPFKKIKSHGSAVDVLLRRYRFGKDGLLSSVSSMDRELLAGASYFEGIVDGKRVRFAGSGANISVSGDGYDAKIVAEASVPDISLSVRATLEQDGFIWNDVALRGAESNRIERLTFVMPLRDREMPLMHACTVNGIRSNPAGHIPQGDGVVWESSRICGRKHDLVDRQFLPYVWLGAERRGICWFMNSSFGTRLAEDAPAVRIVREKDVLRLECDFINIPTVLGGGRSFSFGLEATPVKMPDRTLDCHFQSSAGFCPPGMTPRFFIRPVCVGFWSSWARTPWNGDWSLLDIASRQARNCDVAEELRKAYDADKKAAAPTFRPYAAKVDRTYHDWIRGLSDWGISLLERMRRPSFTCMYSDPTLNWECETAQKMFRSEWVSQKTGYQAAERNFLTPSYLDYLLHDYETRARHGVQSIYLDDMYPIACQNPDTAARCDPEGRWHGNVGILEMRELVKRASVMLMDRGETPRLLQIHMTNCLLVPSFAFANSIVTWEDHYGEDVFQNRFAVDYMLAESIGGQLGAESIALDGIHRRDCPEKEWPERFRYLSRTQQSMLLPMGMKTSVRSASAVSGVDTNVLLSVYGAYDRFGCWEDDCRFVPAYDDDGAIGGIPPCVLTGSYRRPGRVLAVMGNQSSNEVSFKLQVDKARLGFPRGICCYDAETGREMMLRVKIPAYDFRIVEILDDTLAILSPTDGSEVEQLKPTQARIAREHWADCRRYFDGGRLSRSLTVDGCHPRPIRLAWKGGVAPFRVELRRKTDGRLFFGDVVTRRHVTVDSLEIARTWEWTVTDSSGAVALGTFATADAAPRLIRVKRVPNVRDLGGRMTEDGCRVRQGLLFRSAGLNDNANVKDGKSIPGGERLTEAERERLMRQYGFKCDVDLRRPDEVAGMTMSPLGPDVKWANVRYTVYETFTNAVCRTRAAAVYREILNTNNYPLVFHCIAGADRTGTLAFFINGLLGVSQEDALKDYLATGFSDHGITDRRHLDSLDKMIAALDTFPGRTFCEKVESYFKELGVSESEILTFRTFMIEPKE